VPKKAQITQERVEYNVFLFEERPKGSKSLKIFKISLTFRFDKLSNLSKSVHTEENYQILTVSNKKHFCNIGMCHQGKYYRPDKKKIMVSSLWPSIATWKILIPSVATGGRIRPSD
jgi:uncharacterized protein (DUF1015 family)